MIPVLVDHNIEGQAALLWSTLATSGWLELGLFRLVTFSEAGLPLASGDRMVWRFAQAHGMLLLTGNRNMDGEDSLEQIYQTNPYTSSLTCQIWVYSQFKPISLLIAFFASSTTVSI